MGNLSKWKVIGLTSKQTNQLREAHRSKAQGILVKKYNKEYLKILRKLRSDYIKEQENKNDENR